MNGCQQPISLQNGMFWVSRDWLAEVDVNVPPPLVLEVADGPAWNREMNVVQLVMVAPIHFDFVTKMDRYALNN